MRSQGTAIADNPASITPPILCNHPDDVAEVRAESGFCLFVRFFDGTEGRVEMSQLIQSPNAGVFASLADERRFSKVGIEYGAVTWPEGIDLAPDAMYEAFKKDGVWKPR